MSALLCVHPHPDDESIACGGVLARYAATGHRVMVVTCTGGEEGENLAGIDLRDVPMPDVRRRELEAALDALGVKEHEYLGYRDSGMAGTPANEHPDSFHEADLDEAAGRLASIIRSFRPDVVVSDDDRGSYGHPDHVKAHAVTNRAIELAADTAGVTDAGADEASWQVAKRYVHAIPKGRLIQFHERLIDRGIDSPFGDESIKSVDDLEFGVPDEQITTAIDVGPWYERKVAAMRAHASQIGEDSFFLNLPPEIAAEAFGTEFFVLLSGHRPEEIENDLFAGLDEA